MRNNVRYLLAMWFQNAKLRLASAMDVRLMHTSVGVDIRLENEAKSFGDKLLRRKRRMKREDRRR